MNTEQANANIFTYDGNHAHSRNYTISPVIRYFDCAK